MTTAGILFALLPALTPTFQESVAPRQLRIVAEIDGVDELHLNASEARWVHREYAVPERVSINGRAWNPKQKQHWTVDEGEPFLARDIDLAGASATLIRGRGEIAFGHGPDGLILSFDDSLASGAGEYEVLVEFADVLCAEKAVLGRIRPQARRQRSELLIEARIDGRDELHLGSRRADWLHLVWEWPTTVRIGGLAWDPEAAPMYSPAGNSFFSPSIDLERVRMQVERGRGTVKLEAGAQRLFVSFDDGEHFGGDDYAVLLRFPTSAQNLKPLVPSGKALRVQLAHEPAADVAGAKLTVMALSPASGEYVPWPGLRGMDESGRCVLALAPGTYRFEVLHAPSRDRLVALRTKPIRLTRAREVSLPASEASAPLWRNGDTLLELRELAVRSILGNEEVSWSRAEAGADFRIVASPAEEFELRAFGSAEDTLVAWWTRRQFGDSAQLDSSAQDWIQCKFRADAPARDCKATLHFPTAELAFPIAGETRFLTNRRFVGFSYRHPVDGGSARFRTQQVLLPTPPGRFTFELGGELTARGSAAVLYNENLGTPDARQLWWELVLEDSEGRVLDTEASDIDWQAEALLEHGTSPPAAPLQPAALELLADPTQSVVLSASYRWNGAHQHVVVVPAPHVQLENERYGSRVPGHLGQRALAYLDKARRTYRAIELARGKPGDHTAPIELKWWLNGGAVGAWGSITMPIAGMTEDFDWYSFPWALAHESLHAFGYHHGPELDRLDSRAIRAFEGMTWEAESDPGFVPEDW